MAVNGLTNVSAKRGTTAKVKWGKAKLAVKTGIFCGAPRPVKRATTALAVVAVVQFKPCIPWQGFNLQILARGFCH